MELDLFDAIRLHRLVEIDSEGVRYTIEPYELQGSALVAYTVEGPELGWAKFPNWNNLKITGERFTPRERSTS
jgi:hypothetical protein